MAKLIKSNGEVTEVKPVNGKKFSLEELQKFVGGYIQKFKTTNKCFVLNEDGLPKGLPVNEKATDALYLECEGVRNVQDIVGDVLVCELNEVN
jgi:hypothetical protein